MAVAPIDQQRKRVTVYVDDNFHYMNEDERYVLGEFETEEEALAVCKKIVDDYLLAAFKPGLTAKELYASYVGFGEDPWFSGSHPAYSSWEYAKRRSAEICMYKNPDQNGPT